MQQTLATYRDGKIVLDAPVDWPNGTRIEVRPLTEDRAEPDRASPHPPANVRRAFLNALHDPESSGLDESLWPQTPEEISVLLGHMDAAEPLDLTPEEQERIEADRKAWKEQQRELVRKSWQETETLFE